MIEENMQEQHKNRPFHLRQLFYITPTTNIPSILERGILSHARVERESIPHQTIYDEAIVAMRGQKRINDNLFLADYANLFFEPRNAMLLRVLCTPPHNDDNIAILGVDKSILEMPNVLVTNGLAARSETRFFQACELTRVLAECERALCVEMWDGSTKSKRMAECLVPDAVPPEYIKMIYVNSLDSKSRLAQKLAALGFSEIEIVTDSEMFFAPTRHKKITENLTARDGNLFLSRMQTLTISVNCVGVMNKGLASTARYFFPDVYGVYKDLCENHRLTLGHPYLYKREETYDLFDDIPEQSISNGNTWFLLFPTKNHWRERASLDGIIEGLKWLLHNYQDQGIKSLAVPALGCGLGWLNWDDVKEVLYDYLGRMDIPVELYLPS
ncbi:MAG: DarT ssDNA thymidine ADP-ribosyltransferase family protein [Thermoplasmata archaeon]